LEFFPVMPVGRLDNEPCFTNRGVKSVTFQGKLGLPIHRWYRLTPSFSPQLAHDLADHFGFTLDRIDRMRRRQSKTGRYEAVVFMRRERARQNALAQRSARTTGVLRPLAGRVPTIYHGEER
jgi:hypothetical protein